MKAEEGRTRERGGRVCGAYALLAFVCVAIYGQVLWFEFITLDDDMYVTGNPWVQHPFSGVSLKWAFFEGYFYNWHPVTWVSHMGDFALYGMAAGGHHATSALLHAVNAILVFELLRRTTGAWGRSLFVALLFAAHPLRVEAVAWVSERKEVLSAFFGLLTMLAYAGYARRPSALRYAFVALLCSFALMSKSMLVTLPCVLLLLDYWPLQRVDLRRIGVREERRTIAKLVLEKVPLLALSAGTGIIAMMLKTPQVAGAGDRVANAFRSYGQYMLKTLWPADLSLAYLYPEYSIAVRQAVVAAVVLSLVTAAVLPAFRRRTSALGGMDKADLAVLGRDLNPSFRKTAKSALSMAPPRGYLLTGWLWFVGTLVPCIGFIQISTHGMADRYTYLPSIGVTILIVWGTAGLVGNRKALRNVSLACGAISIAVLTALSTVQASYWKNSETIFQHAIQVNPKNAVALTDLGNTHFIEGRAEEAAGMYQRAIGADPRYAIAHNGLGIAWTELNRADEAVAAFREAVRLDPRYTKAYIGLGNALTDLRRYGEAESAFAKAVETGPSNPVAYYNAGGICMLQRRFADAAAWYERLLQVDPGHPMGHAHLGKALMALGRSEDAAGHFAYALRAAQGDPELERRVRAAIPANMRQ